MSLVAVLRSDFGKGAAGRVRSSGFVPAIVKRDGGVEHISLPKKELTKLVDDYRFMNTVLDVDFAGKKMRILPVDIAFHPVTNTVVHIDFVEIKAGSSIAVKVPLHIDGAQKSPGLKFGGKLNIIKYNIPIIVKESAIPDKISVDVSTFGIGRTVRSTNIKLPDGCVCDGKFDVLSIIGRGRKDAEESASETEKAS